MAAPSRQAAPTTTEPDPAHGTLEDIAARYTLRRPEEVTEYLSRYPNLIPLVLEVADHIPQYFGADAPLILEVFTDPESIPVHQELFAIVQTPVSAQDAVERLDRFDEEWWTDAPRPGPGVLVVDFEFV